MNEWKQEKKREMYIHKADIVKKARNLIHLPSNCMECQHTIQYTLNRATKKSESAHNTHSRGNRYFSIIDFSPPEKNMIIICVECFHLESY